MKSKSWSKFSLNKCVFLYLFSSTSFRSKLRCSIYHVACGRQYWWFTLNAACPLVGHCSLDHCASVPPVGHLQLHINHSKFSIFTSTNKLFLYFLLFTNYEKRAKIAPYKIKKKYLLNEKLLLIQ